MHPTTPRLMAVLLAGLTISGVAQADEGRGRFGQQRAAANVSTTVQTGSGNAAGIAQAGTGNDAAILQFGRDNTGTVLQAGSGNTACLIQSGRNLDGAIQQVGDNQTSGLLQTRWGSREIPVDVCSTATTRRDIMAYAPRRTEDMIRSDVRARGRGWGNR